MKKLTGSFRISLHRSESIILSSIGSLVLLALVAVELANSHDEALKYFSCAFFTVILIAGHRFLTSTPPAIH